MVSEKGFIVHMTASFGVLIADARFSVRFDDWLGRADACLYRAKNEGRNRIVMETPAAVA